MERHISRGLVAFAIALYTLGVPQAKAEEPFEVVERYIEALKAGDVVGVKSCLGGRLYETREVLLDQNEEYPDFLRKRFEGAAFHLSYELTDLESQGQGIAIEVVFPSGHTSTSILIIEQAADGSWQIVDEVEAIQ